MKCFINKNETEPSGQAMPLTVAASLLGSWFRIPIRTWMFVFDLQCVILLANPQEAGKSARENKPKSTEIEHNKEIIF